MNMNSRSSAIELQKTNEQLEKEIIERKKAEEEIKRSLSLLNATLESTADGILVVDREGKIEKFNRKFVRMWQIPDSILASKNDDQALAFVLDQLKYPQSFLAKVKELYADPEAESFDVLEFKDGRIFERYSQPQRIEDQMIGRVWSFRDVTERKRFEEKLHESEEYYRQLINISPEGIALTDPQGRLTFVSPTIYTIFGILPGAPVIGTSVAEWVHPEYRDIALDRIRKLIAKEISPSPFEYKLLRHDRTPFWGELSSTPLIDAKGQIKGILTIIHDITERKKIEQALIESEKEAKRLSHENTILAEIGRIVSSTLNIEDIYEHFAEEVRKLIPFDRIVIDLIDIEKNIVINAYIAGEGIIGRKVGEVYSLEGSGNAEMVRTNSTLLVQTEDFNEYQGRFPMLLSTFQAGFRSIMNVPLFSKGKIIGGLLLRSLKPYAYTDNEVRLAERVGDQIAGAITNAQIFAEQKRIENALWESEDRYRDLVEFSQGLICTHDLKGRLLSVNQWAAKTLGYAPKTLIGTNIKEGLPPEVRDQFDEYLSQIREQGSAKGLVLVQTRTGEKRIWEYNNTLRTEGVPEPIVRGMAHDITDRKKMEQALIRNEKVAQRLSQENAIIARIGQIINSTLDIDEVYNLFAEEVRKLIPFDRVSVATINSETQTVTMAYTWGNEIDDRKQGSVFPIEKTTYGQLLAKRSGFMIHVEKEDELKPYPHLLNTFRAGFRSMISVPLISKDEVIGGLNFRSIKPNNYTELDLSLAEKVGHQIAGAIANARLFIERKRAEAEKEKLILQLQKALGEVKQLSGLLPICASCKKIRDDKGYWNQIEVYIRDRSEAEFSHGICPDCFKKLYPDMEI